MPDVQHTSRRSARQHLPGWHGARREIMRGADGPDLAARLPATGKQLRDRGRAHASSHGGAAHGLTPLAISIARPQIARSGLYVWLLRRPTCTARLGTKKPSAVAATAAHVLPSGCCTCAPARHAFLRPVRPIPLVPDAATHHPGCMASRSGRWRAAPSSVRAVRAGRGVSVVAFTIIQRKLGERGGSRIPCTGCEQRWMRSDALACPDQYTRAGTAPERKQARGRLERARSRASALAASLGARQAAALACGACAPPAARRRRASPPPRLLPEWMLTSVARKQPRRGARYARRCGASPAVGGTWSVMAAAIPTRHARSPGAHVSAMPSQTAPAPHERRPHRANGEVGRRRAAKSSKTCRPIYASQPPPPANRAIARRLGAAPADSAGGRSERLAEAAQGCSAREAGWRAAGHLLDQVCGPGPLGGASGLAWSQRWAAFAQWATARMPRKKSLLAASGISF